MILKVHLQGAASYDVGDEIWQMALGDAIHAEAECIVYSAGSDLLESGPNQLRGRIVVEMSDALSKVSDTYRAPDGVRYSLIEPSAVEDDGTLIAVNSAAPVVEEVLCFEDLPVGSLGTRRAVVRWSDGTEDEGLQWYSDLCGYPHKSAYAESRVMPRSRPDQPASGQEALETSA